MSEELGQPGSSTPRRRGHHHRLECWRNHRRTATPSGSRTSTLAVNSTLNRNLPFNTARDFTPIMHAADGLYVLVVHRRCPRNRRRAGRAREIRAGKLNGAIAGSHPDAHGTGAIQFDGGRPYYSRHLQGAGPALTSLLGGETQMAIISMPTVVTQIQSGKLRAIAVTGARRSAAAPDCLPRRKPACRDSL